MNPEQIPAEFAELEQWALWGAAEPEKRPCTADGRGASWKNDPSCLMTLDAALEAHDDLPSSKGVGLIIKPDDPYLALDLDTCLNSPRDADDPRDWLPPLDAFRGRAYMEYSKSGTGIHVIIRGDRPDWWDDAPHPDREHEGVEVEADAFMIFTGEEIDGSVGEPKEVDLLPWLTAAHRRLTGEIPSGLQSAADPSESEQQPSDGDYELGGGNTDEIVAAVDALTPSDLRLSSTYVESENSDIESWDPGYRTSSSGKSLKRVQGESKFFDMAQGDTSSLQPFGLLSLLAAEQDIISNPWDTLSGEDWWDAVDVAREQGADIPEYEAGQSSAPVDDEQAAAGADWSSVRAAYANPELSPKTARRQAALTLLQSRSFATPRDTEAVWSYDDDTGVYNPDGEQQIDTTLAANLGDHYSTTERKEIVAHIRARTYFDREEFDGDADAPLLCVGNGVLDLETRELYDHDPKYLFTRGLSWDYDPTAAAPANQEFLDEITEREEDKDTMLEMVGASLWPEYLAEKFMILFGEGSNGKSVFFDTVGEFLGSENVSGWSLQKLATNRFAKSSLPGKFANIGGDMDSVKLKNTGELKTLTGGDTTEAEEKGKPAFNFVNRATLLFGANRPPVIDEASRAVKRRIVPIRLPYQFTPEHLDDDNPNLRPKKELLAELTSAEEMSGLLNLALDGLDRLREKGDVSLPETPDERLEYYEQFSDPIKEFAIRCLNNEGGSRLEKDSVYSVYKRFCEEEDYTNRKKSTFFRQLSRTTFDVNSARPQIDGERTQVLNDATFTDTAAQYRPDYTTADVEPSTPDEPSTLTPSAISTDVMSSDGRLPPIEGEVTSTHEDRYGNPTGRLSGDDGGIDFTEVGDVTRFDTPVRVRITDAKLTPNGIGALELEFDPTTDVEQLDGDGGSSPTADAVADGGTTTAESDEQADTADTESGQQKEPPNGTTPLAVSQLVVRVLDAASEPLPKPAILSRVVDRWNVDLSDAEAGFEHAKRKTGAIDTKNGETYET